ncbi:MAG: KamA family protein [Deltaproteobacteria bacterium]|nr:KamA family protein [Deltaproteobacteria bacterium]
MPISSISTRNAGTGEADRERGPRPPIAHAALDHIAINVKSHRLLERLLKENPKLEEIMHRSKNEIEALLGVRDWVMADLQPPALAWYRREVSGREAFEALEWRDYAAIRLLDYIDNAGREFPDLNLRGEIAVSNPIKLIWLAVNRGTGGARPGFFEDMLRLFRQFSGKSERQTYSREDLGAWMERFPSGLDPRIVKLREENRERIIKILVDRMDSGDIRKSGFTFEPGMSREQKILRMHEWWNDHRFHLSFAVRSPELLNELLGYSLDPDIMKILFEARDAGIPFFVNPYYLSLLHVRVPYFAIGADLAIRDYVVYTQTLVEEFGHIVAWEKEDQVRPGKPNAAGWLLPNQHNIHRRYPEVAILIPDSMGRACGGLCAVCQRMFDFQNGHLAFDLEKLAPKETWSDKLRSLVAYFEQDTQIRDILITGGDALMSTDRTLGDLLDAVYEMARRKRKANAGRPDGEKHAELVRVRLGTRLPVYLPQRITPELATILAEFRKKAMLVGVQQFVIQTHFEAPMEVTPEAREGIRRLLEAGWLVTNQLVFTTAASRRGHTAKLRTVLNDVGVLPYYTFSVKGYMENRHSFATNARAVQEQLEEKIFGQIPDALLGDVCALPAQPEDMVENLTRLREKAGLPFLATDRNVLNLPGVGKSLTFRVIGITRYGRRILEFDHDRTRSHSPIIDWMGRVVVIESKSISEYLDQLEAIGEQRDPYDNLFGYSLGETEPRMPIYEYPRYDFEVTGEMTNLQL